jgi:hypothetical protein
LNKALLTYALMSLISDAAVAPQPDKPARTFTDERKAAAQAKRDRKAAKRLALMARPVPEADGNE